MTRTDTLERLGPPSGAVEQLIQEARKNLTELEAERGLRIRLERENESLTSGERREIRVQVVRIIAALVYLLLAVLLAWLATLVGGSLGLLCFIVGAVLGLIILDRSVSELAVRVGQRFHLGITRKP